MDSEKVIMRSGCSCGSRASVCQSADAPMPRMLCVMLPAVLPRCRDAAVGRYAAAAYLSLRFRRGFRSVHRPEPPRLDMRHRLGHRRAAVPSTAAVRCAASAGRVQAVKTAAPPAGVRAAGAGPAAAVPSNVSREMRPVEKRSSFTRPSEPSAQTLPTRTIKSTIKSTVTSPVRRLHQRRD